MTEVGTSFAGYRLERLLSTDTVSSIYRAVRTGRRRPTSPPLSLRVTHELCVAGGPDADAIAAYIRSVIAAVKIAHPALVPIADAGDRDDRAYVATAFVDGVTLDRFVRDTGRIAPDDAVALLRDLAAALDAAHRAGVVHAAISPRTIRIRRSTGGMPVAVLDGFGVATLLARQARIDRAVIDVHDVAYVSPEHLRGDPVDGRADQYALACALYHCITGHLPFRRDTVAGLFGAHLFGTVPTAQSGADGRALPGALAAGMAKSPDDRHATCIDLLGATGRTTAPRALSRSAPPTAAGARAGGVAWPDEPNAAAAMADIPPTRRRRGLRLGDRRWPTLPWPVAAMLVLAGILTTLVFVFLMRNRDLGVADRIISRAGPVVAGPVARSGEGPADAGARWQRTVADEPVYDVQVVGDTVVAAAPHRVLAVAADGGATVWSWPVTVGVLTDVVATDDVVALRAAKFRALTTADGAPLWEKSDIVAPINTLGASDGRIYGVGVGRLAPELQAIDPATGRLLWSYDGGAARIDDGAAAAALDGMVAMLDSDRLWVLDPEGPSADLGPETHGARWQLPVTDPWLDSLAVLPDVVAVASRSGEVCAYDPADGDLRWCEPVAGIAEAAPTIVAIRDTLAVIGADVTALAIENGAPRWTFDAPRDLTPVAAGTGSQLVVSDVDGRAHGLDLGTGFEVWRASGFGRITALAAAEEAVYAGTRAGLLVRVEPPTTETPF
jgi:outer membrane protein assembly factor BamB